MRQEKLTKFITIFELHQVCMFNFCGKTVLIFCAIYIIYYSQKELKHFGLEILVINEILECIVLNISKNIFWYKCIKIRKGKNLNYSQRFLNYSQRFQYSQIVYIKKHYSVKLDSISFFLILWHAKVPPPIGMPRYWNRFFIFFFLSSLRFSNLICLTKKVLWLDWKLKQHAWQKRYSD